MGIAELLANQLILPFFSLITASVGGHGINKRHIEGVIDDERSILWWWKGVLY